MADGDKNMPQAQVVRSGNALAVRLPRKIADAARIKEGDSIEIEVSNKVLVLRPLKRIPTLEELVAQVTPKNRHNEFSFGPDRGREKLAW
jgi:antitoxin MazE